MADLRKAVRVQVCQVRIPGYCNHNPERPCWRITGWQVPAEQQQNLMTCRRLSPVVCATTLSMGW